MQSKNIYGSYSKKKERNSMYKNLKIDIDYSSLMFLFWLVEKKKFDAESLLRVLEEPNQNNHLYNKFIEERNQ